MLGKKTSLEYTSLMPIPKLNNDAWCKTAMKQPIAAYLISYSDSSIEVMVSSPNAFIGDP